MSSLFIQDKWLEWSNHRDSGCTLVVRETITFLHNVQKEMKNYNFIVVLCSNHMRISLWTQGVENPEEKSHDLKNNRGWDGWMTSPTRWTWVWTSSGSWWRTGKHGMLQSMASQRVRHNWATELNWTDRIDGFNSCSTWALQLWHLGSVAQGLRGCGMWVQFKSLVTSRHVGS